MDRQSAAYREAAVTDQWDDDCQLILAEAGSAQHGPLETVAVLRLPHHYEDAQWDRGRVGPKNRGDAIMALNARIADPGAPDEADVAGAYDDLDDD